MELLSFKLQSGCVHDVLKNVHVESVSLYNYCLKLRYQLTRKCKDILYFIEETFSLLFCFGAVVVWHMCSNLVVTKWKLVLIVVFGDAVDLRLSAFLRVY